jgi:hypothetical protein
MCFVSIYGMPQSERAKIIMPHRPLETRIPTFFVSRFLLEFNVNPYVPFLQGRLHLLLFRSSSDGHWGPRSNGGKLSTIVGGVDSFGMSTRVLWSVLK